MIIRVGPSLLRVEINQTETKIHAGLSTKVTKCTRIYQNKIPLYFNHLVDCLIKWMI